MSWNPGPTIGSASWQGNPQVITKNQFLSTIAQLEKDIVNYSTISVSTLIVPDWISTSYLNVSTLRANQLDVSGIVFDASGLLYAPLVSSSEALFNITNVSVMKLEFKPTFTGDIKVTFDLGLGQAIGGFLAGLGAAVGGALIGVGTGVGLTIQGAEQGIATMIAGRPENFITNNTYETINFTSQLQVSTLGNASPYYSSIFRTVSSSSANQVPGREIFTSTIFYPGQICIRSVSDPINLITGDSNLNSSTIQSFGQWVPLEGLEPENIVADSVSTNLLEANYAQINTATFSSIGVASNISMNYNADVLFNTGATTYARIVGDLQNLYFQTDDRFVFTQPYTSVENASLNIGSNANESLLIVSSIQSQGFIQANQGFFSSLTVNELTVISTFSTQYTIIACNVLSTNLVEANLVSTINLQALYVAPYTFSSLLGNPTGPFDITKVDNVVSTSYFQVSSLQQNILSYSLNTTVNDQATFNIGDNPGIGLTYEVTPANITQWASTQIIFDGYQGPGGIDMGWVGQWAVSPGDTTGAAPGGATFDVLYAPSPATGYNASFYLTEQSNRAYPAGVSTFYQSINPQTPVTFTARMTLPPIIGGSRSGWWQMTTPCPPPYSTSNNNTLQIYQDINDSYITATDRLHFQSGDIFFDGTTHLSNLQVNNLDITTITACNAFLDTTFINSTFTNNITTSSFTANPLTGGIDAFYFKSTLSYNAAPTSTNPLTLTYKNDSPDFMPTYSIVAPFIGNNYFTSYNYSSWNNTVWNNNVAFSLGVPRIYVGDLQVPLGSYSGRFWINNIPSSPAYPIPIYAITSAGSNLVGNALGGQWTLISTVNGVNWTVQSPVSNPQGTTQNSYSNILNVVQSDTYAQVTNTQNLIVQAPNTTVQTGSMFLYSDQIRVNSHTYGTVPSSGLPSYPIGIENTVYQDQNMAFTQQPAASGWWQSDAANILSNINNTTYYDYNSWIVQVIPSRFRTNNCPIMSYDVQPAVFSIGGGGYAWGYNRYIQVIGGINGPGQGANNWNWVIAFPRNYCTYLQ